jgi:hypothetical protein
VEPIGAGICAAPHEHTKTVGAGKWSSGESQRNCYERSLENPIEDLGLQLACENLCRVHWTLRVTPAMEVGIADHVWLIEEVVNLLDKSASIAA